MLNFKSSLYILDNSLLSYMSFENILSQSMACLHFMDMVFYRAEMFNFNEGPAIKFSFMIAPLVL